MRTLAACATFFHLSISLFTKRPKSSAGPAAISNPALISRFDEFDLLEVPQSRKFKNNKPETPVNQSVIADETLPTGNLSPEEIDAIADRVVEKLSDQVIKRIVREVFNQMSKKK